MSTDPEPGYQSDEAFDTLLGNVLRTGVLLSAAVVSLGGFVHLIRHGHEIADYRVFRGEPGDLRSVAGIVNDARSFSGRGLIQLGLLCLIATPVARVMFSVVGFARQRNAMYVAITSVVLMLLLYSLSGG